MRLIEYSFIYFDDCNINLPSNSSENRTILNLMENIQKSSKIPVFQCLKLRISANDCLNAVKYLQKAIEYRLGSFPERIQILLILYDHPFIENKIQAIKSARNLKSMTKDLDGYSVMNEKIVESIQNPELRTCLDDVSGLIYEASQSLYMDNFLYFNALHHLSHLSKTLLLHVPHNCSEAQMIEVYELITNHVLA